MTEKSNILKIVIVVISYWFISISMVFANKYLVGNHGDENISLFVAWIQCIFTVIIGTIIGLVVGLLNDKSSIRWSIISQMNFSSVEYRPLLKMAGFFVGMLAFNNLCLKIVGVSFYQVARSMTIIFVVIFSIIILKKSITKEIIFCCMLVAGGFVLGVDQEGASKSFSIKGVIFGVVSSVFIALTGIYTKQALAVVDKNEFRLTIITNILATFMFMPVLLFSGDMSVVRQNERVFTLQFWLLMAISGVLGLSISWISAVQINVTSPVSHHVSANCKAILQTIIAVVVYNESKTTLWWFSVCLVVTGAFLYALQKYREEKEERLKQSLEQGDIQSLGQNTLRQNLANLNNNALTSSTISSEQNGVVKIDIKQGD